MVDNTLFTGETNPIKLKENDINEENDLLNQRNLAFYGSTCVYGNGKGLVLRTGNKTLLGNIA